MRAVVRQIGNSSGVVLPKSALAQIGVTRGDTFDLVVDNGRLVLTKAESCARAGWAAAAAELAAAGDDALVWPEWGNDDDAELIW